jgi:hypothetical protein
VTPQEPVLRRVDHRGYDLQAVTFAKDQPEYIPLPVIRSIQVGGPTFQQGRLTSRWKLNWGERFRMLFSGNLWVQMLTFHNALQPVKLLAKEPKPEDCL